MLCFIYDILLGCGGVNIAFLEMFVISCNVCQVILIIWVFKPVNVEIFPVFFTIIINIFEYVQISQLYMHVCVYLRVSSNWWNQI